MDASEPRIAGREGRQEQRRNILRAATIEGQGWHFVRIVMRLGIQRLISPTTRNPREFPLELKPGREDELLRLNPAVYLNGVG